MYGDLIDMLWFEVLCIVILCFVVEFDEVGYKCELICVIVEIKDMYVNFWSGVNEWLL